MAQIYGYFLQGLTKATFDVVVGAQIRAPSPYRLVPLDDVQRGPERTKIDAVSKRPCCVTRAIILLFPNFLKSPKAYEYLPRFLFSS